MDLRYALVPAVLALVCLAPRARAEGGAPLPYPVCAATPSREDSEVARRLYLLGKTKAEEADYATALTYFKDAYRSECTKHDLLLLIARAYELSGNRAEAIRAIEVYLERVPKGEDSEKQRVRLANLKAQMAPAAASSAAVADAGKGEAATPSGSSRSVVPWIVVGGGAAVAITGGVLFFVGSGKVSDAASMCPGHVCETDAVTQSAHDLDSSGRSLEVVGGITGGLGLAAAVGGLWWHFSESREPAASPTATFAPLVGRGVSGLSFAGRF